MNKDRHRIADCPEYSMLGEKWMERKYNELRRDKKAYLLISVNIKNFTYFNMRYGWDEGNKLLYKFYFAMQKVLLEGEYIAHSHADTFLLMLHSQYWDMTEQAAHKYIQTIMMRYVDAIFEVDDERVHKSTYASFGIFPLESRDCSFFEAMELAELFRKQDRGIKHRTFTLNYYDEERLKAFVGYFELCTSTSTALQRGEYQVYVQPKVDVKTRKIVGGEALLRRFDESGKAIALSDFLPILNSEGYIRKIDWFVFETACEIMSERFEQKKPLVPISFNISKDFFYDPHSCDSYVSTYKKYDFPQEYIELELMETISLDDTGHMIEVIGHFKQVGFKCSLDDFGNGYSSFGVLLNADIDYVKLDRIFFSNPLDDSGKKILANVMDILKYLGFKTVAEGVETQEYVDYLTQLGCDIIQGYYFYRPMPIKAFMQLLDEQGDA